MTVVDASVWVALLVADDPHHAPSRRWIADRLAEGEALALPEFGLPEVAGAVARRTGRSALAVRAVRRVLSTPHLTLVAIDAATYRLATLLAAGRRLRGADAVYAAVASQLGAMLVTLDAEMLERVDGAVSVIVPDDPVPDPPVTSGR